MLTSALQGFHLGKTQGAKHALSLLRSGRKPPSCLVRLLLQSLGSGVSLRFSPTCPNHTKAFVISQLNTAARAGRESGLHGKCLYPFTYGAETPRQSRPP